MGADMQEEKMGPQARAAKVTALLFNAARTGVGLTTRRIMDEAGYDTADGVKYLMDNISLGSVPVYFDDVDGVWRLLH